MKTNDSRRFLISLLTLSLFLTPGYSTELNNQATKSLPFTDIDQHWAADAITRAFDNNIVLGYGDGTFRPDLPVTYAEFGTMMSRSGAVYAGLNISSPNLHSKLMANLCKELANLDLQSSTAWPFGTATGPDTIITRQDAASMLGSVLPDSATPVTSLMDPFVDKDQVTDWASDGMIKLLQMGYLKGYEDGRLDPGGLLTRAEAITLLDRFVSGASYAGDDWPSGTSVVRDSPATQPEPQAPPTSPTIPTPPTPQAPTTPQNLEDPYGVVLEFWPPDTEDVYFTKARIRLKADTGETRSFAFADATSVTGADVTSEDAFALHQLIQYHVNADGEIDQVTQSAVNIVSEYTSLQLMSQDVLEAQLIGTDQTHRIPIADDAVAFQLKNGTVQVISMERAPFLTNLAYGSSAVIFKAVADHQEIAQAFFIDDAAPSTDPDPNPATIALLDALITDLMSGSQDPSYLTQITLTAGGVNANSTEFTGEDGIIYRIDPDASFYIPTPVLLESGELGYTYTRESLYSIYPGMTLYLANTRHPAIILSAP